MADPHFIGVASAKLEDEIVLVRLAASDGKSYALKLTPLAANHLIIALRQLVPLEPGSELDPLQVIRSVPLAGPDGRKAILLETLAGAIAYELPPAGIAILQRQLTDLQSMQVPQTSH